MTQPFERALPFHSTLSLSYVGNRGIGFLQYNGENRAQFPVVSTVPNSYPGSNFTGVPIDKIDPNLFDPNPPAGYISLAQPYTNQRRPDGRYSVILQVSNNEWIYQAKSEIPQHRRIPPRGGGNCKSV